MLVLLLVYALTRGGSGGAAPNSATVIHRRDSSSCHDINTCRTLSNIVWSCLTTIFLCTWVSIHPNIAFTIEKRDIHWFKKHLWNPLHAFLKYKLILFLMALFVPEYVLAWAIRQYLRAGEIQKKYAEVPGWTRTHGFFIIMGGFHLFELPSKVPSVDTSLETLKAPDFVLSPLDSRDDEIPGHPLGIDDLPLDILKLIAPTETELKDRGKSDGIAKAIVLVQTLWFVAQCIARGIQHLPLTELEVVTLAYAMMNCFIYLFWWDKPRDVACPIRVYKKAHARPEGGYFETSKFTRTANYLIGMQDVNTKLSRERHVPMFWSDSAVSDAGIEEGAFLGPSVLGMGFGAIHFISWSAEFPSYVELMLWRISCIAMMAVPLLATLACGLSLLNNRSRTAFMDLVEYTFQVLLGLTFWSYIVARIATITVAFTTLRSLPSEAFTAVDWTIFFPHI